MENITLTKEKEELIGEFYRHLGQRFKTIEVASENAPITICATDEEDKQYWIRLVDNFDKSVKTIEYTGTKIDNITFYQLYAIVSNDQNVFHMELFNDGYALWFINDLTPNQMKVTDDETFIGIASSLHVEFNSPKPVIIQGSKVLKLPKLKKK
jgi:hypothetical protein